MEFPGSKKLGETVTRLNRVLVDKLGYEPISYGLVGTGYLNDRQLLTLGSYSHGDFELGFVYEDKDPSLVVHELVHFRAFALDGLMARHIRKKNRYFLDAANYIQERLGTPLAHGWANKFIQSRAQAYDASSANIFIYTEDIRSLAFLSDLQTRAGLTGLAGLLYRPESHLTWEKIAQESKNKLKAFPGLRRALSSPVQVSSKGVSFSIFKQHLLASLNRLVFPGEEMYLALLRVVAGIVQGEGLYVDIAELQTWAEPGNLLPTEAVLPKVKSKPEIVKVLNEVRSFIRWQMEETQNLEENIFLQMNEQSLLDYFAETYDRRINQLNQAAMILLQQTHP